MKDKDKSYLNCVHCGKCLTVCPTYNVRLNEFYSPRGRVRLILSDNDDKSSLSAAKIMGSMSACLLCDRCVKVCPNDVRIGELIIDEKTELNKIWTNKLSIDKLALGVLKNKRKVLLRTALRVANIPIISQFNKRLPPNPHGRTFITGKDYWFKADYTGKKDIKAGYFSGCVFDSIYPQVSVDTVLSLTQNGVSVFVPQMQGCCGLPFIAGGDKASFRYLALKNVNAFKGQDLDFIITSCASCSYSINNLYPLYFKKDDACYSEVFNFSKKLLNIWSFFKAMEGKGIKIKKGKLKKETDAVYHIPCHTSNSSEFKPVSRSEILIGEAGLIVDKINGLRLKPLKHNYCCGNGGMFNIRHYDLSKEITRRKFDEIKEVSPENILTSCSGCMFSLTDQKGISDKEHMVPVKHLISLYAQSLREG